MDQDARRQLENTVMTMGLAGLQDPNLIELLAHLVSTYPGDKHLFFEDLINQVDADKRAEMYHAMAPRLLFKAEPLSHYEANIAYRAACMVNQKRMRVEGKSRMPTIIAGQKFEMVGEADATAAVVTVKCKCRRTAKFVGNTPVQAMVKARKDGWVRDKATNHEMCKVCVSDGERGAMTGANRTVNSSVVSIKTASRRASPHV